MSIRDDIIAAIRSSLPGLRTEYGVRGVYLFGSVARGEARAESDVDVLIEFEPAARPTLLTLAGVRGHLADRLGREVDVCTIDSLRPRIRATVEAEMFHVA